MVGLGEPFIDRPPAPLYFREPPGFVRRLLGQSIQPILDRLDDVRLEHLDRFSLGDATGKRRTSAQYPPPSIS